MTHIPEYKASVSTEGLDEAEWGKPIKNHGDERDYTGGAGRHSFIPHFGTELIQ